MTKAKARQRAKAKAAQKARKRQANADRSGQSIKPGQFDPGGRFGEEPTPGFQPKEFCRREAGGGAVAIGGAAIFRSQAAIGQPGVAMSDRALGVGVIGTGGMGGRHARNLARRVAASEVVAIMDLDAARADAVATACGGATVFTDPTTLIGEDAVDAVVIASPDPTHAELAIACIEAGKPVLCEKPLGVDLDDAKRVLEAEVGGGRRLVQVGLMRMYDPQHTAIKQAIDDGEIGRPLLFRGIHRNLRRPRLVTAAEVIVSGAVHDIQSARWLMGDEVASVYASHIPDVAEQPSSARLVLLQLTFCGGGLATIEVELDSNYGYEVSVEVSGERGTLETPSLTGPIVRKDGCSSRAVEG